MNTILSTDQTVIAFEQTGAGTPLLLVHGTNGDHAHWKLVLLLIAGLNTLYFTVMDEPWELKAGEDAPALEKVLAGSVLILWIAVMYFGSMLPFLGNAF